MNVSLSQKVFNLLALLSLLAFTGLASGKAAAADPDPRMYGPWLVQEASSAENVGLRVFFSPDGNFFLVDPKTRMGFNGTWMLGRSGLVVTVFGNGRWAKLWDADVAFETDDKMVMEVRESQLTVPQRVVLQRLKL